MRSLFALGLVTLALNIPTYAQQNHQDADKPGQATAARTVVILPPLVLTSHPNPKAVSSDMVVQVPDFLSMAKTTNADDVIVPAFTPVAITANPKIKGVSSGLVVKVPDFLPMKSHE